MSNIHLSVAKEFSDAPGARFYTDGPDSGQEFYETLLENKFQEALDSNCILVVNMDETYGYATSFISEAFGSLSRKYSPKKVLSHIDIVSEEDTKIREYILQTIQDPEFK